MNTTLLGATSARIAREFDATFWLSVGILIAIAIVGGVIIMWWRGRAMGRGGLDTEVSVAKSLRELRESGELSQEEYDRARRRLVERAMEGSAPAREADRNPGGKPPRSDGESA